MYSLYEYNEAGHMKVIKEEALSEGIAIGEERGEERYKARIISSMSKNGMTPDEIAKLCDCSLDEILAVLNRS
ncbi:hypothetical protein SAMN02910398_00750 [Butyrivibrio sp. YAB3001]|nr:hypothetical protein SAMN02910398_00750 [Butyrivibrio sp. YAB3001]